MPNRDMTGPTGKGSKTGRGMGSCNEKSVSKENSLRMGMGRGRGGRGRFWSVNENDQKENSKEDLKEDLKS